MDESRSWLLATRQSVVLGAVVTGYEHQGVLVK